MILLNNQKSFELYRQILFRKLERRLVRNFRLLLIKIALGLIIKDFNKVNKDIEDFVVNIDLGLTSSLIIHISKLKLPRITKVFQLIILLIKKKFAKLVNLLINTRNPS